MVTVVRIQPQLRELISLFYIYDISDQTTLFFYTTTTDRSFITINRSPYFMVKNRRKYGETVAINSIILLTYLFLGLMDDGDSGQDPATAQGAYLSFLHLRHLRLRDLQDHRP
jgi:hypothetical protein